MRALLAVLVILTAVPTFSFQLGAPRTLAHAAVVRSGRPVLDETETAEQQSIVTFSERAMQQLEGMRKNCPDGQLILRMGVRAGGCSGMSYVMDLAKPEDVDESDTEVALDDNMKCYIDPKSLMFLFGMKLDYSDELIGGGFQFSNPNAEDTCGCGKSFGI